MAKQVKTLKEALDIAKRYTAKGELEKARRLYTQILTRFPQNKEAEKGLEALQHQASQNIRPGFPRQINHLVELYSNGKLEQALGEARQLSQVYPNVPFLFNFLAACHVDLDQPEAAVKCYKRALEIRPDYIEALLNLGATHGDLGQLDEAVACFEQLLEIMPDHAEAHHNLGNVLRDLGELDLASASYQRSLEIMPFNAEALNNLGIIFKNSGRPDEAVARFQRALEINPDHIDAINNLGNALMEIGRLSAAIVSYKRALKIEPRSAVTLNRLGSALLESGQAEEAVAYFKQALEINPDNERAHTSLGVCLVNLGQFDKALSSYERALEIKPDFATALYNLSYLKSFKPDDTHIDLMEGLLEEKSTNESDRVQLCFALARAYDDFGAYDKGFDHLKDANRLRKEELNYDMPACMRLFTNIKEIFNSQRETFKTAALCEHSAIRPIFIVGMPRSGSTLVEQILASHSKVFGAGEMDTLSNLVSTIFPELLERIEGQSIKPICQQDIVSLRDAYLEKLKKLDVTEQIITDKALLNFRWIGFLLSAFPTAKIINMNRDPMAVCWSNYKHNYTGDGNGYAYDLGDMAQFYLLYSELMLFWREHFPHQIYDICYENLTENQEIETRKLLHFCDLDWEERCLSFHKTKRVVRTSSATQVRKKIYTGSSEAWKNYESHLQPLIKSLGY